MMQKIGWQGALVLLGSVAMTGYFALHAHSGTHGIEARNRLLARSIEIEREVGALDAVRLRLDREVGLLAAVPPDPDMVEEIARETLGMLYPDEKILP